MAAEDVLIVDGLIARIAPRLRVPADVHRIDGTGKFLSPGLIDSHVHLATPVGFNANAGKAHPELLADYRAQVPRAYLAFGFTTLVDVDLRPETREWFERAKVRPHLLHCGPAVRTAGGYGALRIKAESRVPNLVFEPTSKAAWPAFLPPADFTPDRAIQRIAETHGSCVKAFSEPGFGGAFDWPMPSIATLVSLRKLAHQHGWPLLLHANSVEAWRIATSARVDIIAHGLWHWPGPRTVSEPPSEAKDAIAAAARAGLAVQPTLQVLYGQLSLFDDAILDDPRLAAALPPSVLRHIRSEAGRTARQAEAAEYERADPNIRNLTAAYATRVTRSLQLMTAAGVRLVFGSDTPAGEGIGNPPGLNGRLELQRWADAGVSLEAVLRAATLDNAVALGLSRELGTVTEGKRADLLLLSKNPLESIDAFDAIEMVLVNGVPVLRPVPPR